MAEVTTLRLPETAEQQRESASGGCCEPDCGPETCGTQAAELPIEVPQVKQTAGGCCGEPDCTPETCS